MVKRILIVEVNWLGDVLFSTPFIRAVRQAHPGARIACLVHPRCHEILEGNPRIDDIIVYDEEGSHRGIIGKISLALYLRGRRFDTAYILHRSFTKAAMAYLSGAGERIGYPTKNRTALLTKAVEEPDACLHKVDYFLNLLPASGITARDRSCEFFIRDEDRRRMDAYLSGKGIGPSEDILALCPGGNWDPKRWPGERFAELADMLARTYGMKTVITGAAKEKALAERIKGMMKSPAVAACGDTTLKELGAIFERSRLVVANDTGSMHIAVAMKANVLALFGPTSPDLTGPCGEGNHRVVKSRVECDVPCYDMACRDNRCMRAISVEEVFEAVRELIEGVRGKG